MHKMPSVLAPVLYIPGLLFEALIRARSGLYAVGLRPQHRLPGPVISVGNITMGGAGKTPLVIYVAQMLSELGANPVVLTRGYGRRNSSESLILPPGRTIASPALTLGDEPALIRRHVPSAWMGISRNRFMAGSNIAKQQTRPAFILDDGFQHRGLHRDLDIVIIDQSQPLRTNRVFPRGTLREPVSEMGRCQVIVINVQPGEVSAPLEEEVRSLNGKAAIFHCSQTIRSMIPFPAWKENQEGCIPAGRMRSAYLVAALGNPERFQRDVQRLGIDVRGARFFSDHHQLNREEWLACRAEAQNIRVDAIITTEKDAVKISQPPDFPLMVSVQSTQISDAGAFKLALKSCIEEYS